MEKIEKIRDEIKSRFEMLTARSSDENGFAYGVAADQLLSLLVFIDTLGDDGSSEGDVRPPCVHYSEGWGCTTSPTKVCSFCRDYVPSVDTGCAEGGPDDTGVSASPDRGVPSTLDEAADFEADEVFDGVGQFRWGREHVKHLIRQAVKYGANWYKEKEGRALEMCAAKVALAMQECFFNELMSSFTNIIRNLDGIRYQETVAENHSYYTGKAHAFREIAERIRKEYDMSNGGTSYFVKYGNLVKDKRFSVMEWKELEEIRARKNRDVDSMLDARQYVGTKAYDYITRFKGRMADRLQEYASEGFRLGVLFKSVFDGVDIGDLSTIDHVDRELEKVSKSVGKFDPAEFERECVEMFIPPQWRPADYK